MSVALKKYKLGDLMDVTRGASLAGEHYATEGDLVRLTLGNFDYDNCVFKENTSKDNIYYTGDVNESFILNEGDVITPLTEQTPGLLGTTARIPESGKYIQSQDIALIKCKPELLDRDYAYYLLPSKLVKEQLAARAQQTKIRHTSPDKIKDCTIFIPNLEEQKRIAATLRSIDDKIAINSAICHHLEKTARYLYDYYFNNVNVSHDKWAISTLGSVAKITMGLSPDGSTYNDDGNGMIFYQGCTDFGEFFPEVRQYTTDPTRFAKKGDILVSVRAPVGAMNIANSDCCIGRGLAAIHSDELFEYLYFVVKDLKVKFDIINSVGTTFGAITKDELFDLSVIMPDNHTLKEYLSVAKLLFNNIKTYSEETILLLSERETLLPLFMSGQLSLSK